MEFFLVTPAGVKFHGPVREMNFSTTEGQVAILPHHESFVALVAPGSLTVRSSSGQRTYDLTGGVFEIKDNVARILTDEEIIADQVLESSINEATTRAREITGSISAKARLHQAQELLQTRPPYKAPERPRHRSHHGERFGDH